MEGYAVDFVVHAVEEEALFGVEMEFTDAEGNFFVVDWLVVFEDSGVEGVQCAMFKVPAVGMGDRCFDFKVS